MKNLADYTALETQINFKTQHQDTAPARYQRVVSRVKYYEKEIIHRLDELCESDRNYYENDFENEKRHTQRLAKEMMADEPTFNAMLSEYGCSVATFIAKNKTQ